MTGSLPRSFGLVVFDLDGTLACTIEDLTAAANAMLARRGAPPVAVETTRTLVGDGATKLVERVLAARAVEDDGKALEDFLSSYDVCLLDRTRLRPGALDVLAAARPAKVAVCTNKPRRSTARILEGLGLLEWLDDWLAGDDLPAKKPDPLPIVTLADRLGAARERTVVVGDGLPDILAARAAGATSVALLDGYGDPVELAAAGPDHVARTLADVTAWLGAQLRA